MDGTKTTTNWIIAGLVALVVIIGGGWLIARERSGTMAGANATSTESTSTGASSSTGTTKTATTKPTKGSQTTAVTKAANATTAASGESVNVGDQPAGASVTVAQVSVSKPTWVAVRDTTKWYPGAKLVSGEQTNVTIPLLRNTVAGKSYEVVLFVDNGDGKFSIHGGDMLVTGAEGAPVSATFKAQ